MPGSRFDTWNASPLEQPCNFLPQFRDVRAVTPLDTLNLYEPLKYVTMSCEDLTNFHERTHDKNAHLDHSLAFEDTGEHRDSLLGEDVRQIAPPPRPFEVSD